MDKQYKNTMEAYSEEFTKWTVAENLEMRTRISELEAALKAIDPTHPVLAKARGEHPPR